jgi:hypothetical protein
MNEEMYDNDSYGGQDVQLTYELVKPDGDSVILEWAKMDVGTKYPVVLDGKTFIYIRTGATTIEVWERK